MESVQGILERCDSGTFAWDFAAPNNRIHQSDRFRTGQESISVLSLEGPCRLFLNEETEVRIEKAGSSRDRTRIQSITLLRGTLFLVASKNDSSNYRFDIITPLVRASFPHDASCLVAQDGRGQSLVFPINGVATVRPLQGKGAYTVAPPEVFRLYAGRSSEMPKAAVPADTAYLDWMGAADSALMASERAHHRERQARLLALLSDVRYDKVRILPFQNESDYRGVWNLEQALPMMITDRLRQFYTGPFEGPADGPATRATHGAAKERVLVLTGRITDFYFETTRKGGIRDSSTWGMQRCGLSVVLSLESPADRRMLGAFPLSDSTLFLENEKGVFDGLAKHPFSLEDTLFARSAAGIVVRQILDTVDARLRPLIAR